MRKQVIVAGCGRLGAELAYRLFRQGNEVTILDREAANFSRLHQDFRGRYLSGDLLAEDLLHRAGISEAEGFAAVTTSDTVNAVLGHVARNLYRVPKVVVRNYESEWRPMMEAFGLQTVSPASWGAQRFAELLDPAPLHSVFSAGNGEVQIYEVQVPAHAAGKPVAELSQPGACQVVALTRSGKAILPTAETTIESGDILHVSATQTGRHEVARRLGLA